MRIVSLLPSCTELLFTLGQAPVGVSHSCDHPPAVSEIPTVTSSPVEHTGRSASEIDAQMQSVSGVVYDRHTEQVAALDPDLVVTQATCDVCAVDATQVQEAVARIGPNPEILTLDPHSFSDVLSDSKRTGDAVERSDAAAALTAELMSTVEEIERRAEAAVTSSGRPRTTVLDEVVADHLDYRHHEAFFVVSTTFEVTAYRTLWFGLQYDSETIDHGETVGNGALATVRWYDGEPVGDGHLQGQFAALKDVGGDMLDRGVFTPSTARQYLKRKLAERVGDRQELLIPNSSHNPVRPD